MAPEWSRVEGLKEQAILARNMFDANVHPNIPYEVYVFLRGTIDTFESEIVSSAIELGKANDLAVNRPLLQKEVLMSECGSEFWVEYNRQITNRWTDEPMFRDEQEGRSVITNRIGFWPLDRKTNEFGHFYRVWRHRPTALEKKEATWA